MSRAAIAVLAVAIATLPPGGRLEAGTTPGTTGLTVEEAMNQAIAHSPELKALEAGVAEATANAALADAFHPGASVSTTPGYATGLPIAVLGSVPAIGTIEAHRLLYDP